MTQALALSFINGHCMHVRSSRKADVREIFHFQALLKNVIPPALTSHPASIECHCGPGRIGIYIRESDGAILWSQFRVRT